MFLFTILSNDHTDLIWFDFQISVKNKWQFIVGKEEISYVITEKERLTLVSHALSVERMFVEFL